MEYSEILKRAEAAAAAITDQSLKSIAFDRLLEHELALLDAPPRNREPKRITPTANTRKGRTSARTASGVREDIERLRISPDADGLPPWNSLAVSDKYLWTLMAAKNAGVDGLTGPEISSLIFEIFRETHQSNQISNLKTKIRLGFVQLSKNRADNSNLMIWQILPKGIQHLQSLAVGQGSKK
jgi:hypothetical protein